MKRIASALGLSLAIAGSPAIAQGFDPSNAYIGGGISHNSASNLDDGTGFQFLGGYKLDMVDLHPVELAVEVGYMDTGNMSPSGVPGSTSFKGLWTTAVFTYGLTPELDLIGRAGLDLGDDDGLMVGAGLGYAINRELELRGEYVIRDNINSLQANLIFHF
ncbi:hypothetical protein CAI21_00030 [Alkalilimnicola ehrlichii]|uniref:Outer membrane protein beta-barrel domain-containing protein n=1 Tax=Alkalilimnicola ehrlichii TaxID=351052 RepID=A0A3E0X1S7_9GAMM|nr:outer membrane beta-barrel protein [Alkalilimnicola ehrlichii]RFA31099.1 hypothetical protein CAI21_00030 [Alkalilimnicola ehrlichii]RFA39613.1 hypothetical protein CAL65_02375 [Alkalilimnicola ehrlichii]